MMNRDGDELPCQFHKYTNIVVVDYTQFNLQLCAPSVSNKHANTINIIY